MFTDPDIQLAIARQVHRERLARAAHRRLVTSLALEPGTERGTLWRVKRRGRVDTIAHAPTLDRLALC